MIEEYESILECENALLPIVKKKDLLGEFYLSVKEVNKLGCFIKDQISGNLLEGVEFLQSKAPTCLTFFLVWKGILEYDDGDYWSAIKDSLDISDPNWLSKLGKFFINFLEFNGLPSFNIQDVDRYVTPILLHGMIPNSCLDEYFDKILVPMVKYELIDPHDCDEICFWLKIRRENIKEINAIKKDIQKLVVKKNQILNRSSRFSSIINIWDDLDKIKTLEKKAGNLDEIDSLPKDISEYIEQRKIAKQNLEEKIKKLSKKIEFFKKQIKKFSEQDKEILSNSEVINKHIIDLPGLEKELEKISELNIRGNLLKKQMDGYIKIIFSKRWNESYAEYIRSLPLDLLKDKIEEFNNLRANDPSTRKGYLGNILKFFKRWISFFFLHYIKKEKKVQDTRTEILKILKDLPINEEILNHPKVELIDNLKQLNDDYKLIQDLSTIKKSLERKNDEKIKRISRIAKTINVNIPDDIKSLITNIKKRYINALKNKKLANQAKQLMDEIEDKIITLQNKKKSIIKELKRIDDDFLVQKQTQDGEVFELTKNFYDMVEDLEGSYEQIYLLMLTNKIVSAGIEEDEEMTYKEKEKEAIRRVVEA